MTYAEIVEMMARAAEEAAPDGYSESLCGGEIVRTDCYNFRAAIEAALSALSQHIPVREILSGDVVCARKSDRSAG